jgi:hypothetical protein
MSNDSRVEDLDLAIPDMDSTTAESQVAALLRDIPGIVHVRLSQRGAFVRYRPVTIDHERICSLIRQGGFRASTFQDSETGDTGVSSQ